MENDELLDNALDEIYEERNRQRERWGNAFDDTHTPADWVAFVVEQMAKALNGGKLAWKNTSKEPATEAFDWENWREHSLKAATILVAAVEAVDRRNN
jgi:hypothetical protein